MNLMTVLNKKKTFQNLALAIGALSAAVSPNPLEDGAFGQKRFEDYEIRVIRPRYFAKRKRLELGTQFTIVTNQTFIYTYMVSGLATFHLNEYLALEGSFSYGGSVNKDDQNVLANDFGIQTLIIRTQSMFDGALLWTPIYGKYQLSSGRLIYFDTFLLAGVGQNTVEYQFDHCDAPPGDTSYVPPENYTKSYPGFSVGGGQRYFLDKKKSIRWDIRYRLFSISNLDGECDPQGLEDSSRSIDNVTVQMGMSYFL